MIENIIEFDIPHCYMYLITSHYFDNCGDALQSNKIGKYD